MKKACCLVNCCCCLILLMVAVALAVLAFWVVQKGMEPPSGYTRSEVPLGEKRVGDFTSQIKPGLFGRSAELTLSEQDLRSLLATNLQDAIREGHWDPRVSDVQVDVRDAASLPSFAIPQKYPVPLSESIQLEAIVAVNFAAPGEDSWLLYFRMTTLAGVNDCKLYWSVVDLGIGSLGSILDLGRKLNALGGNSTTDSEVQIVSPEAGVCLSELGRVEEGIRLVGTEAPAEPTARLPAEEPAAP